MSIKKVAVIGSGVMGAGIAAQVANAGLPVVLLDIVPKDAEDRNMLAKGAVERMLNVPPVGFMKRENAALVTCGNLEDDWDLIADCDWVCEVVLEDLKIKHDIFSKIEEHGKEGAIVSSNTSTIPLEKLIEGHSKAFGENFVVTHFFNPPRYMKLLELIVGEKTSQRAIDDIREFCDSVLGKGIVDCNDRPGFIANRLGFYWISVGIKEAVEAKVPFELADAVMSKPVGIPKTGIFGLLDLVGIDLLPHIWESLQSTLPQEDAYNDVIQDYGFLNGMIDAGFAGRKGKGGFYRMLKDETGKRQMQVLSLTDDSFSEESYKALGNPDMPDFSDMQSLLTSEHAGGQYAWKVLSKTLAYAAALVPEVTDTVAGVDEAMRLGFNWKKGPFEMMDDLGPCWLAEKLKDEGLTVPPLLEAVGNGKFYRIEGGMQQYFGIDGQYHNIERPTGVILLKDIKLNTEPLLQNNAASLWEIGDGVLCFEMTGKANTFDMEVFDLIHKTVTLIEDAQSPYKALVIYNEGAIFSAGANLATVLPAIESGDWEWLEKFAKGGQAAFKALKFSNFPVVAAPSGRALGGGCEVLLNSNCIQAHAETYCGLVEPQVGLIPGWGGCKEVFLRQLARNDGDTTKAAIQAFKTIVSCTMSGSAQNATELGFFKESDNETMNGDRLLFDAKKKALEMAKDFSAPIEVEGFDLPDISALEPVIAELKKTEYDETVFKVLAGIYTNGSSVAEEDLLVRECAAFMTLLKKEGTKERISYMLKTGKPLKN